METKSILQTRTFWSGLLTLITGTLSIIGIGDDVVRKATQIGTAVLGFGTLMFLRDSVEQTKAKVIDVNPAPTPKPEDQALPH